MGEISDKEIAEKMVRIAAFVEDVFIEAFAMHLFLEKKGLYEEYLNDRELYEKVERIFEETFTKIEKEEKE